MTTIPAHSLSARPVRHHIKVLGQLLKYIPRSIVSAAAAAHGVDAKARSFSVWSHMGAMVFVQLAHALSLNDVCDWLRLKVRAIAGLGLKPPSRNNLSHANKNQPWRGETNVHLSIANWVNTQDPLKAGMASLVGDLQITV